MKEKGRRPVHRITRSSFAVAAGLAGLAFASACLFIATTRGQQPSRERPSLAAEHAPPMKYLPSEERERLAQETDLKKRARLHIELAESRLLRAEQYAASARFSQTTAELGIYQAIIEDAMRFLQSNAERKNGKVSDKVRDLYKRIELTLRAHGPRLETIRRSIPSEEAVSVRAVFEYTRDARSEALNSFYGESVLREEKAADTNRPKEPNRPPEEQ